MKRFLSLLVLLVSFLIVFSANSNIIITDAATTEENETYWKNLIEDKEKEMLHMKTVSMLSSESLNKRIMELSKFREAADFKLEQLRLGLVSGIFSPYSFRATTRNICIVIQEINARHARANKRLNIISNYVEIVEEMKRSIDSLLNKNMPSDVKTSLRNIRSNVTDIGGRIAELRDRLKAELIKYEKSTKIISESMPRFKSMVMEQIIEYYLKPSRIIYNPNAWIILGFTYKDRVLAFYHKLIQGVPDFQNEWAILVSCFSAGIFVFLLGRFFFGKYLRNKEVRRKMFVRGLFWAILGFIIFTYSDLIDFYPRIYFNYFLIVIFWIISIMYLSWGFRCKENAPERKSPFEPILWLFIYGIILQFADVYYPVLSVLWLAGIIINIFYLKKQMKRNYSAFEKAMLIISLILYICCIAMVLIGLVYLSILVLLTWFIVCLSMQLGINVNISSRKIVEYFAGGSHSLLKIIVIGIIAPVVWLMMLIFIYYWLVGQTFGSELLVIDLNTSVHIYGLEVHLSYVGFGIYLFFVFRAISNMTKITVRKLVSTSKIEAGAAPSIALLASYVLWCLYLVILLNLLGVNLTNIAVVTGGLSVGLGFGLRDMVNNFLSSLIILLSHSIRHGDIIEIDGTMGKVLEITIRSTLVQTNDNAIVSIPNSEIISSKLINWTSNNTAVRKDIKVGVSYNSDIEKVKYILLDIAKNAEHVLADPAPSVIFNEFADSSLNFVLSVWIDNINIFLSTTSDIREKINTEFKANGIAMAYPQLEVHLNHQKSKKESLNT